MGNQTRNQRARAQETASADMLAAQREKLALAMRLEGWDFDTIAERCGYSSNGKPNRSAAYKAYKRALARIPRSVVAEARDLMCARYDVARRAIWPHFSKGDPMAVEAWLALDERESKLMGYDKPVDKAAAEAAMPIIREYQPGIVEGV